MSEPAECPVCETELTDESDSPHWCSPECQEVWQDDEWNAPE